MPSANWPTVTSWPGSTSWPAQASWPSGAPFPATVAPAVWFDGRSQAYSDLAGTLPVSSGLMRRLNDPAPLVNSWTTPTDPERSERDSQTSVRFDMKATGGAEMTHPAVGGLVQNACTIVVSWVARDSAYAGPLTGLFREDALNVGVRLGGATVWVYNGSNWFTTLSVAGGYRNTLVIRYTPTGIDLLLNANGTVTTDSLVIALPATALAALWRLGFDGATTYMYGSVAQAMVVGRAITDQERLALAAWAHAQPAPDAYPTTSPLVLGIGDSITRSTSANYNLSYLMLAVENARASFPTLEVCNVAVGGGGVTGLLDPLSLSQSLYVRGRAFYSSARSKNIAVWLLGSNDLGSNSVAYTLYGTGGASGTGLYPAMLDARSRGWKNILMTIGPRTDPGALAGGFVAKRTAANIDMATNWTTYADAFVDTRGIVNFGGDLDPNNPTYYSADLVHPLDAGHALIEPAVRAAILSLL